MSEENQNEEQSLTTSGVVHDVGVLDLRYAKSPEDIKDIRGIHDVGVILISEEAAAALNRIEISDVGSIVTLPANLKINCMTGQIRLSGEALQHGDPETILMIVGQTMITDTIQSVGYKEVRIVGQLLAPRDSQAVLSAKLTQLTGQVLYIPSKSRLFMGNESINQEFLELLSEPTPIVVMGNLTLERDVTKDMLKTKIPEIVLMGNVSAPKELATLVNVITVEKMGKIEAYE